MQRPKEAADQQHGNHRAERRLRREQSASGGQRARDQRIDDEDAAKAEAADDPRRERLHRERADRGGECHQP